MDVSDVHQRPAGLISHIAGVVVQALPAQMAAVRSAIVELPGAQVHGADARGKLVVTLERADDAALLAQLAAMQALHGVLSAVVVYQHSEAFDDPHTCEAS